jgi:3-deoxy-manno-octulosonate cytidylyltransferase (CMP-KDO synthetase)
MNIGLIPARLKSTRLPNKPLLNIEGMPLLMHVYFRAKLSKKLNKVIICADDKKIYKIVKRYGAECVLTSKKHRNGTERICEVAKKLNAEFIIDIQCDACFLDPEEIDNLILFHKELNTLTHFISNAATSIDDTGKINFLIRYSNTIISCMVNIVKNLSTF